MFPSSRSPSPPHPLRLDSPDDTQSPPLPWAHESRLPFRVRPRHLMILFFGVVVATLALLSRHPRVSETSLDPRPSSHPLQNTATPTPSTSIQTVEPVVFALIMYSEGSAREGAMLLKTAIMYTSRPIEFHIVCDDEAAAFLDSRFSLLTHPVHSVTVRLYRPTFQSMVDRIAREGSLNTGHAAGIPGLMKLFLHEILPETVKKAIFADTDAFFLTDPALLWDEFSHWGPNVAVSIPYHPNLENPDWYNASKICSCVMLLHLEKLRSVRLMDSNIYRDDHSGLYPPALAPPTFTALFGPPGPNGYHHVALGDQSYWWAIVHNHTEIFQPLPLDWEVTSCLLDMYGTTLGPDGVSADDERNSLYHLGPLQGTVVVPKLLHFNCIHDPAFYDGPDWSNQDVPLTRRWGAAVQYHVGFKWIWLNRAYTRSPVDIQVVVDPIFADQRFALEHPDVSDPGEPGTPSTDA